MGELKLELNLEICRAEAGAETGRIVVSADGLQIVFDFCIVVCVVPAW